MTNKANTRGTLLYPGVILKGENLIAAEGKTTYDKSKSYTPRTILKTSSKKSARTKKLINILIED